MQCLIDDIDSALASNLSSPVSPSVPSASVPFSKEASSTPARTNTNMPSASLSTSPSLPPRAPRRLTQEHLSSHKERRTSSSSLISLASTSGERQRLITPSSSPTPSYASTESNRAITPETPPHPKGNARYGSPPPPQPSDTFCPVTSGEHELRTRGEEMALMLADVAFTLVPLGLLT